MAKTPLGKLPASAIGLTELPRRGIEAVVPASLLRPTIPSARIVGQALTVLNRKSAERRTTSGLADIEAHNLAEAGDVLVVQGVPGISSMGGVMASIGKRQGELGECAPGKARGGHRARRRPQAAAVMEMN